jgi:hypothetical protein
VGRAAERPRRQAPVVTARHAIHSVQTLLSFVIQSSIFFFSFPGTAHSERFFTTLQAMSLTELYRSPSIIDFSDTL